MRVRMVVLVPCYDSQTALAIRERSPLHSSRVEQKPDLTQMIVQDAFLTLSAPRGSRITDFQACNNNSKINSQWLSGKSWLQTENCHEPKSLSFMSSSWAFWVSFLILLESIFPPFLFPSFPPFVGPCINYLLLKDVRKTAANSCRTADLWLTCIQLLCVGSMWLEEVLPLFNLLCCSSVLLMAKLKERADINYINISIYNINIQDDCDYNAAVLKTPSSETVEEDDGHGKNVKVEKEIWWNLSSLLTCHTELYSIKKRSSHCYPSVIYGHFHTWTFKIRSKRFGRRVARHGGSNTLGVLISSFCGCHWHALTSTSVWFAHFVMQVFFFVCLLSKLQ